MRCDTPILYRRLNDPLTAYCYNRIGLNRPTRRDHRLTPAAFHRPGPLAMAMGDAVRTLLVINARLNPSADSAETIDRRPRQDYRELQRRLSADVLDLCALHGWWRLPSRVLGGAKVQAFVAWLRASRYDTIFVDR